MVLFYYAIFEYFQVVILFVTFVLLGHVDNFYLAGNFIARIVNFIFKEYALGTVDIFSAFFPFFPCYAPYNMS